MSDKVLNINIGLLGHVDSGKTSLAKCLSQIRSTACFDKNPQSQERGITIDLGFSALSIKPTKEIISQGFNKIQVTLVDCPGHASLIRTIIGGVHIIDIVILVIDLTKGIQTQTAECLIISEVTKKPIIVVLNKIDLVEPSKRNYMIKKVKKKMEILLAKTFFKNAPILPIVTKEDYSGNRGIDHLIEKINEIIRVPKRFPEESLVLAVDHCFSIKGKGTIMTGTILQGSVKLNDNIEIPSLQVTRKVKSIQVFKHTVDFSQHGDRIGVCLTQFDPNTLERGIACKPGSLRPVYGVIMEFNKVKYFKNSVSSNVKYHISVGYETLMAKLVLFSSTKQDSFNFENEYPYLQDYNDLQDYNETQVSKTFAFLEFDRLVFIPPNSIIIGSKLDSSVLTNSCRIAFFGDIVYTINDKNYHSNVIPKLKIYKLKQKASVVQKVINENEVIGHKLFQKDTLMNQFINMKVTLSTGEIGFIEGTFGQNHKIRIRIPEGLKADTFESLSIKKRKAKLKESDAKLEKKEVVKVNLTFKKYLFVNSPTMVQDKGLYDKL